MSEIQKVNHAVPTMTARHFNYVAGVMAQLEAERPVKSTVVKALSEAFAQTNPNFRADWFEDACYGVYPSTREVKR